jgi:predicted TIM-barrel fold metal-dependent hydrolase
VTACDCHVHVFGPRGRYPQLETRAYTAGLASVDSLRRNAAPLGITRFVVVQASVNGTDNSCVLDTMDALDGAGRGVVVVDPKSVRPSTLDDWWRRGIRGLRINLYSDYKRGGLETAALGKRFEAIAGITPPGGHVEVIAPLPILADAAALLARSSVPVVIDHYGLPGAEGPEGAHCRTLLDLLSRPHVWMKLSGPYRALEGPKSDPLATAPPADWIRAFVNAAADRLVWGSDWPHTPPHEAQKGSEIPGVNRPLSYEQLVDDFLTALPSIELADRMLRENPDRLYGFAD